MYIYIYIYGHGDHKLGCNRPTKFVVFSSYPSTMSFFA